MLNFSEANRTGWTAWPLTPQWYLITMVMVIEITIVIPIMMAVISMTLTGDADYDDSGYHDFHNYDADYDWESHCLLALAQTDGNIIALY